MQKVVENKHMAVATSPVGLVSTEPLFPSLMACLVSPICAIIYTKHTPADKPVHSHVTFI